MKKLLLLILFLSACSQNSYDFRTSYGTYIVVEDTSVTKPDMEFATTFVVQFLPRLSNQRVTEKELRKILKHTWVFWYSHAIPCEDSYGEGAVCNGLQRGYFLDVYFLGTVGESAFFHELMHLVDFYQRRPIDYDHADRDWWDLEGVLIQEYRKVLGIT